jgi:hypothetical protein
MKEQMQASFKIVDNGCHPDDELDKKNAKKVLSVFQFAEGQPKWVENILRDFYNIREPFDVISFFNAGAELSEAKLVKREDLNNYPSHTDKVNYVNIQDLSI